ncbi:hypothetical protein B0J18DRAFT_12108 [Chaetomium sp. MPI-SDFR-AT-0129]|nr:hypothetical protein B0J18DRAFT_12108 [Chaetomium sp. MPI-SDFR-AT-0129]
MPGTGTMILSLIKSSCSALCLTVPRDKIYLASNSLKLDTRDRLRSGDRARFVVGLKFLASGRRGRGPGKAKMDERFHLFMFAHASTPPRKRILTLNTRYLRANTVSRTILPHLVPPQTRPPLGAFKRHYPAPSFKIETPRVGHCYPTHLFCRGSNLRQLPLARRRADPENPPRNRVRLSE